LCLKKKCKTMQATPVKSEIVSDKIKASGLLNVGKASIRELVRLVNEIEAASGDTFVRMEMGVPGLAPVQVGVDAEIAALRKGVASIYPMIDGIPELKFEISKFVKNFINIDVDAKYCLPSVGSMQGGMAAFLVANRCQEGKTKTLFIDPGFPVQKQQLKVLGMGFETFDVYNYRGDKLKAKLESYLSKGDIATILYSNPNNPSWICFTEEELKVIGELATKHNVVVIEDLAYFAMDFRKDLSKPGEGPYQSTVANYTDNYILLISSSKSFSYAGQRIGMLVLSTSLANKQFPDLKRFFSSDIFGYAMVYGALYSLSSGTCHSAQYGLAAILKAVNSGEFNFVEVVKAYGEKAKKMKEIFLRNGFHLVYDKDEDQPLADGFYFTVCYPGFSGDQLIEELLYYGVSAISLSITGSERLEGLRACVSQVRDEQLPALDQRLATFHLNHPVR